MCFVNPPKQAAPTTPDPPVFRNSYLDGLSASAKARRLGTAALTIQPGAQPNPNNNLVIAPPASSPTNPQALLASSQTQARQQ